MLVAYFPAVLIKNSRSGTAGTLGEWSMHRAKAFLFLLAGVALLSAQSAFAKQDFGGKYHAPAMEVMMLPPFCWGQYYNYPDSQPQYHIDVRDCGHRMNHYCPALISLHKGEQMFNNQRKKRDLLELAKRGIEYTIRGMKQHPQCPIRRHVEASLRRVNMDLRILPPK